MPTVIDGTDGVNKVDFSEIATGTPDDTTFLRGDGEWATPPETQTLAYKEFTASGTYIASAGLSEFYVFVVGSTGGQSAVNMGGGRGGPGYSEKKYTAPFAGSPYSFTIGAAGTTSGTAGGTTTFDTISVTGSGGVTSITGSAGGVASGGDFNANGGAGGTGRTAATPGGGGGGGSGSRAGNGGNGGNAASGAGGGGGGTGGNNASGATPGIAATTEAVGVVQLPLQLLGTPTITFAAGSFNTPIGGSGAAPTATFNTQYPLENITSASQVTRGRDVAEAGSAGKIFILEVY